MQLVQQIIGVMMTLVWVVVLAGCGAVAAPAATPMPVVTEAVIVEDTAQADMLMVGGKLYVNTGEVRRLSHNGVMDGTISSVVDKSTVPAKDDQSNFGLGYSYRLGPEDTVEVCIDDQWHIFAYQE